MKSELSNSSKDGDLNNVEVLVPGEYKPTRNNVNTNAFIKGTRNQNVKIPSKKFRKHGNSSSTKPPQNPRHSVESVDENIRKSCRVRIATTPFQPESSTKKKGQENDEDELKLAAASARNARKKACSNPFWQQTETLFAPITPEGFLLLKQPRPYEVHGGIRSQVYNDERETLAVIPKDNASTEQNLCEQGSIKPASNAFKLSTVPSLHQRLLAALLDEDEIAHMDEIQSEDPLETDLQSNDEQCEVDAGAHFMREHIIHKVLDLPPPKKVEMPIKASLQEQEYQSLSLDDKLLLELQSIGINPEMPPEETEGLVEQEIKFHEEKLRQKGSAIKDKFMKIEKDIEHEQDFDKRSAEVAPFEKLVEIANRKLPAWRKNRFSNNPCTQKNLSFIARTLDRCKEFEETGRSCFSVLNPPCPTKKENAQLTRVNNASTDSTEAGKISKARCSGTINITYKRKRGTHNKPSSTPLQTPVPDTSHAFFSCSSELPSNQNIKKANNDAIVRVDEEENESDREMTKRLRTFVKRKKMSDVLSSRTTLSPTTTTTQQEKQQPSKTVAVENVGGSSRARIMVMDAHISRGIGEEDGLRSILDFLGGE